MLIFTLFEFLGPLYLLIEFFGNRPHAFGLCFLQRMKISFATKLSVSMQFAK